MSNCHIPNLDLTEFNALTKERDSRTEYARVGDSILSLALHRYTSHWNKKKRQSLYDWILSNKDLTRFMRNESIKATHCKAGSKEVADYFEAWIGYLAENKGDSYAQLYCFRYLEYRIHKRKVDTGNTLLWFTREIMTEQEPPARIHEQASTQTQSR
jgi:hypothetical protein